MKEDAMKDSDIHIGKVLDAEIRRVAAEEGVSLEDLVIEIAELIDKTPRHIYNYRAGKWVLPSSVVSMLNRRFKSRALQDYLVDQVIKIADDSEEFLKEKEG